MPRPRNNPDEVNVESPVQEVDQKDQIISNLEAENARLRSGMDDFADRIARLEGVQNQNKLRKYDEINDVDRLKRKEGFIPSMDGKDPIVSIIRKGKSWTDENNRVHDEQSVTIKTASGVEKILSLQEFVATLSGYGIPCQVNNWDELMEKYRKLQEKKHQFQRMNGSSPKSNTVELLKEIKEEEEALMINVTLSEDMRKSYTGLTIDVPWQSVFNAIG